jgi:putative mRNA 3-end processing factor
MMDLLEFRNEGIYCTQGDFYIDPWKPVPKAIITHAHSDHARMGMGQYIAHALTCPILKHRLGASVNVSPLEYHQSLRINGVSLSLHPAGHIIGSAQVRLEYKGEIWVVSGDYKIQPDPFAQSFEPVKCHTFITESTFGLPVYRWQDDTYQREQILNWWQFCIQNNQQPVLFVYSLGKAQRVLNLLQNGPGPVYSHGAIFNTNQMLREMGLPIPLDLYAEKSLPENAILLAPPSADQSAWLKKFGNISIGMASGWMSLRGARRRRNADRGFVISDHADWEGLNYAVQTSGAEKVFVTHGYSAVFAAWLSEKGLDAAEVKTQFEGEMDALSEPVQTSQNPEL